MTPHSPHSLYPLTITVRKKLNLNTDLKTLIEDFRRISDVPHVDIV